MQGKRVTVLIPALNEESTIGDTVTAALAIGGVGQVIVIDDGSWDRTASIAEDCGAMVVSAGKNLGKGGALNMGSNYISGDVLLLLDADLGKSAAGAEKLVEPVLAGRADMTVAVFPQGAGKAGFGMVKGLARAGIRHFTGIYMDAPLSGQRAMKSALYFDSIPLAGGFGVEVDLTLKAARRGYSIIEVPVEMFHRETGRDVKGILHRGRQFMHVAGTLFLALQMVRVIKYFGRFLYSGGSGSFNGRGIWGRKYYK
ncbi:MAG: glycosyltransferase [Firmicutes bacterium]|nr:glycosyltransferase [Bacillota bacterium]MCL5057299.1 glycosyltransferase [Actinomycetota bacterium]